MKTKFKYKKPFAGLVAATMMWCLAQGNAVAQMQHIGANLTWLNYGSTFGSSYNSTTVGTYLTELKSYHINLVRVWACEDFDGLVMNGDDCQGWSGSNLNNIKNFVTQANSKGMRVEIVFINYLDVQRHPGIITKYWSDLVWYGVVNICRTLNGMDYQLDLVNEGNIAVNTVSWSQLRQFCSAAVADIHQDGEHPAMTMSDQNSDDFINHFSTTVGGLGFNIYEYHSYNNYGSVAVTESNVGNAPLFLGEYGPAQPWNNHSDSFNQTILDNVMNNCYNAGYHGASFWCYLNDGSNWQLRGTAAGNFLLPHVSWWAQHFGL